MLLRHCGVGVFGDCGACIFVSVKNDFRLVFYVLLAFFVGARNFVILSFVCIFCIFFLFFYPEELVASNLLSSWVGEDTTRTLSCSW